MPSLLPHCADDLCCLRLTHKRRVALDSPEPSWLLLLTLGAHPHAYCYGCLNHHRIQRPRSFVQRTVILPRSQHSSQKEATSYLRILQALHKRSHLRCIHNNLT